MVTEKTIIHKTVIPENNQITSKPNQASGTPPVGYKRLNSVSTEISSIAKKLLGGEFGSITPFELNGEQYLARVEPHYHQPPPPGADASKYPKPWGWHKGVTVYQKNNISEITVNKLENKKDIFSKIDDFLNKINW